MHFAKYSITIPLACERIHFQVGLSTYLQILTENMLYSSPNIFAISAFSLGSIFNRVLLLAYEFLKVGGSSACGKDSRCVEREENCNVILKHHKNILIQKFKQLSLELIYNVNAFIFQNLKHDLILCFAWGYFFLIPLTYEIVNASNNFSELLCPPYLWDCTSSNMLIPSHVPQSCSTSKYLSISSIPTIFPLSSVTTSILNIPLLPFF